MAGGVSSKAARRLLRAPRSAEALLARGRLILGSLLPLQSPQPGAAAGTKKSG